MKTLVKSRMAAFMLSALLIGQAVMAQPAQNARVAPAAFTCDAPAELYPSGNCGFAELSWSAVAGAVSYTVEYKRSNTTTWLVAASAATVNYLVIYGTNGRYDWRVRTNCAGGTSGYTTGLFFIFKPGSPACSGARLSEAPPTAAMAPEDGSTTVSFKTPQQGEAVVSVYNMNGTEVYNRQIMAKAGLNQLQLNGGSLNRGVYRVQVAAGGKLQTQKLIIQ
jgi:hypothetical protein